MRNYFLFISIIILLGCNSKEKNDSKTNNSNENANKSEKSTKKNETDEIVPTEVTEELNESNNYTNFDQNSLEYFEEKYCFNSKSVSTSNSELTETLNWIKNKINLGTENKFGFNGCSCAIMQKIYENTLTDNGKLVNLPKYYIYEFNISEIGEHGGEQVYTLTSLQKTKCFNESNCIKLTCIKENKAEVYFENYLMFDLPSGLDANRMWNAIEDAKKHCGVIKEKF